MWEQSQTVQIIHTISFNADHSCIALATSRGFKIFNTQPLRLKQKRDLGAPLQMVEMYDRSNLLALVGFENSTFSQNKLIIFDDNRDSIIASSQFDDSVLALRLRVNLIAVALKNKIFLLDLFTLQVIHVIPTLQFSEKEPYHVMDLSNDPDSLILVCPSLDIGKVLVVNLEEEKQRQIKAHQSNLSYLVITFRGDKVATTSERGNNIRIFSTANGQMLQEVRRGNQYAVIYSLNFNRNGSWLSCTSDSNIVHVFNCKPSLVSQNYIQEKKQTNPTSKFYFLRKVVPYFDAEYSYCQYVMPDFEPDLISIAGFSTHDDNLIFINDYGSFRRIQLPEKTGKCTEILKTSELLQLQ